MTANEVEIPADLVATMRNARAQIEQWKQIETDARKQIEQLLGESEFGTVDGSVAVRWTHSKPSRLDQQLLRRLHPDVFAECQTVTESRRFTITEEN